jgi:hypothetical protein
MTNEQLAFKEVSRFETWMRDTIDSIYIKDDESMSAAYDRVFNNSLEIIVYENTKRERNEPS